jgi:hypothetical protein
VLSPATIRRPFTAFVAAIAIAYGVAAQPFLERPDDVFGSDRDSTVAVTGLSPSGSGTLARSSNRTRIGAVSKTRSSSLITARPFRTPSLQRCGWIIGRYSSHFSSESAVRATGRSPPSLSI